MKTSNLLMCALFAALTAVGAFIRIPFGISVITLQFFFAAMSGLLLGAKLGALSQAVYVAIGLIGIPVFTQGGGLNYVFNATFGFLLGLIPATWLIGYMTEAVHTRRMIILACISGLFLLYLIGVPYMALILNIYQGKGLGIGALLMSGMIVYLPGDALKIVVCAVVAPRLLQAIERK